MNDRVGDPSRDVPLHPGAGDEVEHGHQVENGQLSEPQHAVG